MRVALKWAGGQGKANNWVVMAIFEIRDWVVIAIFEIWHKCNRKVQSWNPLVSVKTHIWVNVNTWATKALNFLGLMSGVIGSDLWNLRFLGVTGPWEANMCSYSAKGGMHLHSHLVLMGHIDLHWSTAEYFWTQIEVSTMLLDTYYCILQHKNIRTMFVDTAQSRNIQAGRVG